MTLALAVLPNYNAITADTPQHWHSSPCTIYWDGLGCSRFFFWFSAGNQQPLTAGKREHVPHASIVSIQIQVSQLKQYLLVAWVKTSSH